MKGHHWVTDVGTCPTCGKRCYLTKRTAVRASRQITTRTGRLHPYRCGDYWHLGHLPRNVVKGAITRRQLGRRNS